MRVTTETTLETTLGFGVSSRITNFNSYLMATAQYHIDNGTIHTDMEKFIIPSAINNEYYALQQELNLNYVMMYEMSSKLSQENFHEMTPVYR